MLNELKISFYTTCMGRLHHLQKTLPVNLQNCADKFPNVEFVVLDYNSRDGLEEWIHKYCQKHISSGLLNYYRTTEPDHFKMSHAKNMAALLCTGDILVNVDADNFLGSGFYEHVMQLHKAKHSTMCRCARRGSDAGTGGRISLLKEHFIKLGGYEEKMEGWGVEDSDLRLRGRRLGLDFVSFNPSYCRAIYHDDQERAKHHTPPGKKHIPISESVAHNRQVSRNNTRRNIVAANRDTRWGVGTVTKNFGPKIEVGSHLDRPKEIAPKPPIVLRPPNLFQPKKLESFLPPKKKVGHFVLSKRFAKQINRPI